MVITATGRFWAGEEPQTLLAITLMVPVPAPEGAVATIEEVVTPAALHPVGTVQV
jgi:hypothetical protein